MDFEWDENKNRRNIEKHGISFNEAAVLLAESPLLVRPSPRSGEMRYVATGNYGSKLYTVVYTLRGSIFRIISARRARKNEERAYRKAIS